MISRIAWVTLLAAALSVPSCTAPQRAEQLSQASAEVSSSVTATTAPPTLSHVDHQVPGACILRAYTSTRALVSRTKVGSSELLLLDLASGRTRSLVGTPVAMVRGLTFGGSAMSDHVVAWEEVSPRDADSPDETVWRLYACTYDPSRGLKGRPVLIDGSERGASSRPLFGVDGHAVVYLTNERVNGRWMGRVERFDLATSERTTLLEGREPFDRLSLSEGRVMLTRTTSEHTAELLVLSPGRSRPETTSLGVGQVSHFPQVHDGVTAWSVMSGKEWPDLFLQDSVGRRLLAHDALDPVFAGDYLFYESNEASDSPRDKSHYGSIWGIRRGAKDKFRLLSTDVSTEGWWQTAMAQGYVDDVFVVANDMSPWNEGMDACTLVRVYRLR